MAAPTKLFKYRRFDVTALNMITDHGLYYADPRRFNDPLDCDLSIEPDVGPRKLSDAGLQPLGQVVRPRDPAGGGARERACRGLAITGGFLRGSGNGLRPVGLARTAGRTLSPLSDWPDGGVFSVVGGKLTIGRVGTWRASPSSAGMPFQFRPLLVFDGKVDEPLNDRSRANRIAVGTMRDGRIAFIGAFTSHNDAVTLREFAQDAISILGPGLATLLDMDGGPSAFMLWPDDRLMPAQGKVMT